MPVYEDNIGAQGTNVTITCDDSSDRRSRAAQIGAFKRAYEKEHHIRLTLDHKSYSEAHGFLSRSAFRYKIERQATPLVMPAKRPSWPVKGPRPAPAIAGGYALPRGTSPRAERKQQSPGNSSRRRAMRHAPLASMF
jgi:hypothetical protein